MGKPQKPVRSKEFADKKVTEATIANLKTHPLQEQMFPGADLDIDSLVASIEELGLLDPIKIQDMTIVCGHRRVEAFRRLGRAKIPAIVLDGLTEIEVNRLVVSDNFHRRQLSPLARARCAAKLYELSTEKGRTKRIEAVAKLLSLSPKEVQRYLNVVDAPIEVQHAYEQKRVALVDAGAIGRLPPNLKDAAVAAIRAGESPKPIIQRAKSERPGSSSGTHKEYRKVLRSLDQTFTRLDELVDRGFAIEQPAPHRVTQLKRYAATINKLLALENLQVSGDVNTSKVQSHGGIVRTPPSRTPLGHDVPASPVPTNKN